MKQNNYLSLSKMQLYVIITFVCLLCYYNSLQNGLVHDDIFAVENNPDVLGKTPVKDLFFNDFWGKSLQSPKSHKSFRPLCTLTFRLNYYLHELNPFGYHLVNVILHVIVSNYFFHLLQEEIFKEKLASFLAALIFSSHPIHVEAVTGVVGRADVLSCLLFLLTFHCYIRTIRSNDENRFWSKDLLLVVMFGSMTLFVKEHSVMIFPVCIGFDIFKNKKIILSKILPNQIQNNKSDQKKYSTNISLVNRRIVFIVLWTAGLFQLRLYLMGYTLPTFKEEDNQASFSPHLSTRVLSYLYLISFNAQLLLSPSVLCYDWQIGSIPLVENLSDTRNIETGFCMVVLIMLSTKLLVNKTDEHILVGLLFLVIPFLPASNFFIRVGFTVAERILYIPSLGFSILVASGFCKLYAMTKQSVPHLSTLFILVFGVAITLFTSKTIQYNRVWYSRESLFRSGIETLPHNAKVHYNFANFLKDQKKSSQAIYHYQQAVKLYPKHSSSHNNLGTLLADNNAQLKTAEYHFKEAIKYTPGHYNAMLNLAGIYSKTNRFIEAEEMLMKCLSLAPKLVNAQKLLAYVLSKNNQKEKAMQLYETLIQTNKDNDELIFNFAVFLQGSGHYDRSIGLLTSLLSNEPKNHQYLTNLASIYKENNQPKMAKQLYERAISYHPTEPDLYHKLALFHFHGQELEEASHVYKRMVENSSPTTEHWRIYAVVLFKLKKYQQAIDILEKLLADNDRNLHAHYALLNFLIEIGDVVKAKKAIDRALKLFPNDVEILLQTANLKRSEKKYEESIQLYKSIISKNAEHFDALLNLGTVYHIMKDYKDADKYYGLAYQINPSSGILKENMQKLKRLMAK